MSQRILILSDINSSHTQKWVLSLADKGFEIGVFSLSKANKDWFSGKINIFVFETKAFEKNIFRAATFSKLSYLRAIPALKKTIRDFKPDIVHAHYATSYGLLGTLSGFHPFIISVWGSDVFDFPKKSFFHKVFLKNNFSKADILLSTSRIMAEEIKKYTSKKITVTPFGVDLTIFKPDSTQNKINQNRIVIGTVKSLETKYGINFLISAFAILKERYSNLALQLLIVGSGSREAELKEMVLNLKIEKVSQFTGFIDHSEIVVYQNMLSIAVFPSVLDSESFGVSVLEAAACGKPVVVSNVGGLPEVIENGITGIIVPPKDSIALANALEKLILDEDLRVNMGKQGRIRVQRLYDWNENVQQMTEIYQNIISINQNELP
ncbi:MAG: glycosyltransferase [Bacteroidia bacterium]